MEIGLKKIKNKKLRIAPFWGSPKQPLTIKSAQHSPELPSSKSITSRHLARN